MYVLKNMYNSTSPGHTSAFMRLHELSTSHTLTTPQGLSVLALLFSKVMGDFKTLGCVLMGLDSNRLYVGGSWKRVLMDRHYK
jgi:hypothetical protein